MEKTRRASHVLLTERDLALLQTLQACGWLSTGQIRNWFFPGKSTNAVCKRLRKLIAGQYLGMTRCNSTEHAFYRLASWGKLILCERLDLEPEEIHIPTQLPGKLHHFMAINDLRFAFEQLTGERGVTLASFFSEHELSLPCRDAANNSSVLVRLLRAYRIIPDALARIRVTGQEGTREVDLAIEFDAGSEHTGFFGRTKVERYTQLATQNQEWLAEFCVLTVASSIKRIVTLMRQVVAHGGSPGLFYFATAKRLGTPGWEAEELFLDPYDFFVPVKQGGRTEAIEREVADGAIPQYALATLPAASPCRVSLRRERGEVDNL